MHGYFAGAATLTGFDQTSVGSSGENTQGRAREIFIGWVLDRFGVAIARY
jgi:hypothetical protein